MGAVEATLGWETRKQPDWFREKGPLLSELIDKRNWLFQRWSGIVTGRDMFYRGEKLQRQLRRPSCRRRPGSDVVQRFSWGHVEEFEGVAVEVSQG